MTRFNPKSEHKDRAVQAWLILAAAAMERKTLTYKGLSIAMFQKPAQGVLARILGHVAFYCIDNKLPPLTSIVVGQKRGTPGAKIPMDLDQSDKERESVYSEDWYDIYPPTADELHASYKKHMANIKKAKSREE